MSTLGRSSHSILVVDDSEAARYAIARTLRAAGYRTIEAQTGAEALELAEFVSAVVLDVHLPDVHGIEVCRMIRARPRTRGIGIVHVSAHTISESERRSAQQAGATGFLSAPVEPSELLRIVDALVKAEPQNPGDRSGKGSDSVLERMTRRERLHRPDEPEAS
jgi:CheY-like chemotaxis protein